MSSKKKKKARRSSEKSQGRRRAEKAAAAEENSKPTSRGKLLGLLVAVLVVGLAVRFVFTWMDDRRVADLAEQAESARSKADWEQLEIAAREWAFARPEDPQPWGYASEAALGLNNPLAAVNYLQQMPADAPVEMFHQLGLLQMEALGDPLAMRETCELTIASYPGDAVTHQRLLYYYLMTAQRLEVIREARRGIEVGADTLETYAYLLSAKWLTFTNGYETNESWLQVQPENELFEVASVLQLPGFLMLDVMASEIAGDGTDPIEFVEDQVSKLRTKFPKNVELLAYETEVLCRSGDSDAVAERLSTDIEGIEDDSRFWRFKGWYYASQGEWEAAKDAYEQALKMDPLDWATQLELAAAVRAIQGFAEAQEMQKRADLGKRIKEVIQESPNMRELDPPSIYGEMVEYFRLCGESEIADKLESRL